MTVTGSAVVSSCVTSTGRSRRRLRWFREQELVEVAIAGDRGADRARVVGLPRLDQARDPPRLQELGNELRVGGPAGSFLGRRVTTLDQQALDEAIRLRQGLRRRIDEQGLETLPLRLPLVAIETGSDHENRMRATDPFETLGA